MDCRGAGDSEHSEGGHTIEQYAEDVIAVANSLGLEKFTYVGHSMGGGIGDQLGVAHGERLNKLVLVAPIPASGINAPASIHEAAKAQRQSVNAREEMIGERMLTRIRAPKESVIQGVDRALSVSEAHFDYAWASMQHFNVSAQLKDLVTPTLLVAGAADGLCVANVNDWQQLLNATLHVFSRVGHGIPRDVPEDFSLILADFMEYGVVNARTQQEKLIASRSS